MFIPANYKLSFALLELISYCEPGSFLCGLIESTILTILFSSFFSTIVLIIVLAIMKKSSNYRVKILINSVIIPACIVVFFIAIIVFNTLKASIEVEMMRSEMDSFYARTFSEKEPSNQTITDYQTIYKEEGFEIREAKILNGKADGTHYFGNDTPKRSELRAYAIEEESLPDYIDDLVVEDSTGYPFVEGSRFYFIEEGQNLMLETRRTEVEAVYKGFKTLDLRVNNKFPFETIYTDFSSTDGIHWTYSHKKLAFTNMTFTGLGGADAYRISTHEFKDGKLTNLSKSNSYVESYGPNYISDRLAYFATQDNTHRLVWDEREFLIDRYDSVPNSYCCDAVVSRILTNGKLIDFYGIKGDEVYHVQAGKFED